jgi:hypothetical protein
MYYTVYKTTNKINGKIYIGSHKTRNLNDNYLGSGKYLKHSIEKYGIDSFIKEILFVFDTAEQMYAKEAEIVNEDFISEQNTYNLKVGGFGGFDYLNAWKDNPTHSKEHMSRMSMLGVPARNAERNERFSNNTYRQMWGNMSKRNQLQQYDEGRVPGMLGKIHSVDSKRKISIANSLNQRGTKNSQFGTLWITDGVSNKKINKTSDIPPGWCRGRTN